MKYIATLVFTSLLAYHASGQLDFVLPPFQCPIVNGVVDCPPIIGIGTVPAGANNLMGGDSIAGAGHKMFWHGAKCAVRAGQLFSSGATYWDEDSLGVASASFGADTRATGDQSFATGYRSWASGAQSVAMGFQSEAHGTAAIAFGLDSKASGLHSIALGQTALASGTDAIAIGEGRATGQSSIAIGEDNTASGLNSMVIGTGDAGADTRRLENNIANSLMIGFKSNIPTLFVGPAAGLFQTGKVGIGTSNPQQALDVAGAIKIGTTSTGFDGSIRYHNGKFEGYTNNSWQDFAGGAGGSSVFSQNNTDAYYTAGNVGIGTSTPSTELEVNGDVTITGSIVGPSDRRLKKEIKDLTGSLEVIKALSPKTYHYRSDTDFKLPPELQYGFIAQEVEQVLPRLVVHDALTDNAGKEYQGLIYQQLIPLLVQAIQEMDEENQQIRKGINHRIELIEARIQKQSRQSNWSDQ